MIRPLTLFTMLLAAGSGAYMFAVKHKAQVLDDQLASVAQQTRLDQQRIRVLQAQWALETTPQRLQQLAAQFTDLQPMKPAQLVTLASLTASLPPAGKAAPADNPVAPMPPPITSSAPSIAETSAAAPPAAEPAAPESVASASPEPKPAAPAPAPATVPTPAFIASVAASVPAQPVDKTVGKSAEKSPPAAKLAPAVKLASAGTRHPTKLELRQARLAARSTPHNVSHLAPVQVAENLPPPHPIAPVYHVPVAPRPQIASVSSDGGSALTMAADLPPPRPLSESNN